MEHQRDSPISVLCVDDEPGLADLIGTYLERCNDRLTAVTATSGEDAAKKFAATEFDCIVSDYDMPGMDGLSFLETVRAEHPTFPFILFTGRGSEEIASEAISAGVSDYMQKERSKDQYEVLARRIVTVVERNRLTQLSTTVTDHSEAILNASPNAILVTIDSQCVYSNPEASSLLTKTGSSCDVVDRHITDFFTESEHVDGVFKAVQSGEGVYEQERLRLSTPSGSDVPVEVTARKIMWGADEAVVYIMRDITDDLAYEQELEYQQSLLDATFEVSPDGILITTDDWEVIKYNQRFLDLWGISEDILETGDAEVALESVLDRVENPGEFREEVTEQYSSGVQELNTLRLVDGTILDQYVTQIELDNHDTRGKVWFYRDVTELLELEEEQDRAFNRMTDGVVSLNDEWEFTFFNEQAAEVLKRDPEAVTGRTLWEEFPDIVGTDIEQNLRTAKETGETVTYETSYTPLGITVEVRAFPSETGVTLYIRDITKQRRTEKELREGVKVLHNVYEIASDSEMGLGEKQQEILSIGKEYLDVPYGFITHLTEQKQTIVESTRNHDELTPGSSCPLDESYCRKTMSTDTGLLAIGDAVADGWESDPAYERFGLGTYIGGKILSNTELYGTVCFAGPDARESDFSDMEQTFVEVVSRWLSYEHEQRSHQKQLEMKNQQLEEFASIVSHDLRNPLTVASGRLELAREENGDSEDLDLVKKSLDRMEKLIQDILTLSKEGEIIGNLTHVNLPSLTDTCWETVDTQDATLHINATKPVLADENRLTQVLENLIRNAVEHGGRDVTVTVGDLQTGFYVEDNGAGIPEGEHQNLFEYGYTTTESGTGVGLRIVKKVVDAHGWDISVTTGADGGTRFEITGIERPSEVPKAVPNNN